MLVLSECLVLLSVKNIQIKCVEFYLVVSVRRSSTIDLGYLEEVELAYLVVMGVWYAVWR
jgi:hypothetical protein